MAFMMIAAFKALFRPGERKAAAGSMDALIAALEGGPTAAGVSVTPENAMRCSVVYASVLTLAQSVGQLPCILYKRSADGGKERASDHPLFRLLREAPCDWMSATEFFADMTAALCQYGAAFAYINRASSGRVVEIIPIPSPRVTVETDPESMEPRYLIEDHNGTKREYDRSEILHLKTVLGLSPIQQAKEAIGLALAMERHAARLFGKGARPSGILKYDKPLSADAIQRLKASFEAQHGGAEQSGGTVLLEDGFSFEATQFSSVDAQFLESRKFQVQEIARAFRMPLNFLQDYERVTHSNAEEMGRQFLSFTLLPWLRIWTQGLQRCLLLPDEREDYVIEFLTDDIARADLGKRFEAYALAVMNGLLSPNEIRQMENRPAYPGGDQYRLPMNTEDPTTTAGNANGTA